jgi:phage protein D
MEQRIGKLRRETKYILTFPTLFERQGIPSKVELTERSYGHDILKLEFNITQEDWITTIKTGLPVKFEWTQGSRTRVWVGYVSFLSREKAVQLKQRMVVTCIGVSFVLKQNATRVFNNKTILEAVSILAKENGLLVSSEPSPSLVAYPQLTITNESYWEWIVRRAKSLGYGLRVNGTTLELKPLQSFVDGNSTDVPVLQHWGSITPNDVNGFAPTLNQFKMLNGEFMEHGEERRTTKKIFGIDPLTGKEFVTEATPTQTTGSLRNTQADVLFDQTVTDFVSTNKSMAKSKAEGAALLARFNIPARALAQGDPRMTPFSLVYIDGTGKESDGYWMIDEVKHTIDLSGVYQAELQLLSDGSGVSRQTMLRPATASISGKVNLNEVVLSKRTTVSTSPYQHSVLEIKNMIIKTGDQGFNRTPSRWVSKNKEML